MRSRRFTQMGPRKMFNVLVDPLPAFNLFAKTDLSR
jgi:hypothetical protein